MPAPDLDTLYDVEHYVEAAVKAMLEAESIVVADHRSNEDLITPRAEVMFAIQESAEHYQFVDDEPFVDSWRGNLSIACVTNRAKDPASHRVYVRKVRRVMSQDPTYSINEGMDYHTVIRAIEAGTEYDVAGDDDLDASRLNFSLQVHIRPDAWPIL